MSSVKRDLLNYAEFLRSCGNLYLEPGAEGMLAGARGTSARNETLTDAPTPTETPLAAETAPPAAPSVAPVPPVAAAPIASGIEGDQPDFVNIGEKAEPLAKKVLSQAERESLTEKARRKVETCTLCTLHGGRTQTVYGVGSLTAKIVFVGEAPGAEEDRTGVPFVGRGGQLLTKMIEAIGFTRDEVYICNTLNCRPPNNRDPLPGEKQACEPFLMQQLEWIQPQILVGLGAHAASYLTGLNESMGKMRRRWHDFHGIATMVIYHPAFLLRSPSFKKQAWEDMQMLMAKYTELNPNDRREIWRKSG